MRNLLRNYLCNVSGTALISLCRGCVVVVGVVVDHKLCPPRQPASVLAPLVTRPVVHEDEAPLPVLPHAVPQLGPGEARPANVFREAWSCCGCVNYKDTTTLLLGVSIR